MQKVPVFMWVIFGVVVIALIVTYNNYKKEQTASKSMASKLFTGGKTSMSAGDLIDSVKNAGSK